MEIKIAEMKEDQLADCVQLLVDNEPWISLGYTFESMGRRIRDPSLKKLAATMSGKVVGFISFKEKGGIDCGFIPFLVVHKDYRRQGMGARLLEEAEAILFETTPSVFLTTNARDERAKDWYKSLGYREVGDLPDYIVRDRVTALMWKTIGPKLEHGNYL